jgi:hypothetical protein
VNYVKSGERFEVDEGAKKQLSNTLAAMYVSRRKLRSEFFA